MKRFLWWENWVCQKNETKRELGGSSFPQVYGSLFSSYSWIQQETRTLCIINEEASTTDYLFALLLLLLLAACLAIHISLEGKPDARESFAVFTSLRQGEQAFAVSPTRKSFHSHKVHTTSTATTTTHTSQGAWHQLSLFFVFQCVSGSTRSPVFPHQIHVVQIDIQEHYYYKILNDFPILIDMLKPTLCAKKERKMCTESALGLQADQLFDVLRKLPTLLLYRCLEMSEMSFVLSKAF